MKDDAPRREIYMNPRIIKYVSANKNPVWIGKTEAGSIDADFNALKQEGDAVNACKDWFSPCLVDSAATDGSKAELFHKAGADAGSGGSSVDLNWYGDTARTWGGIANKNRYSRAVLDKLIDWLLKAKFGPRASYVVYHWY